jgi:FAD/FMN-containing dehydrogenase
VSSPAITDELLRTMGGLSEMQARVHRPTTVAQVQALFAEAAGRTFSLVGARHSFNTHFFPAEHGEAIDVTSLGGPVTPLEVVDAEHRWFRAPGGMTFEALAAAVPAFLTRHPPTSDLITLGGALAACTHDSIGLFADQVRRFTLLTPDGQLHDCRADAEGLDGELFRLVPGSFGALGLIVDLELRLYAAPTSRAVDIRVHRGALIDDPDFTRVSELVQQPGVQGAGMFLYGLRGPTVLFEARVVEADTLTGVPHLPLTDDDTTGNAWLQATASVSARLTNWFSLYTLADGRRFRAPIYGHAFFQRSYARAGALLSGPDVRARALRLLGLNPRLPVVHQTFVIPASGVARFFTRYFALLAQAPELIPRIEQQDVIRPRESQWPLHGAFGIEGGAFLLTTSIGVSVGGALEQRARQFMGDVAKQTFDEVGAKTLLLKHTHGDPKTLYAMHGPMLARLSALKAQVDPKGLLQSRFFEGLLQP